MSSCGVDGCDKPAIARGWCPMHYRRWRLYGDPATCPGRRIKPLEERFWTKVQRGGPDDCWLWGGATTGGDTPYGSLHNPGGSRLAHVISYVLFVGAVPPGFEVDHTCFVPLCVNPAHLEAVPPKTNNQRRRPFKHHSASKTHCPQGHAYDEANTYRNPTTGNRTCRACGRERARVRREAMVGR